MGMMYVCPTIAILSRLDIVQGLPSSSSKKRGSNSSLEEISPWLVSSSTSSSSNRAGASRDDASKIPQMKTVITTEL